MSRAANRRFAWTNALVTTVNAGIDNGTFALDRPPVRTDLFCARYWFRLDGVRAFALIYGIPAYDLDVALAIQPMQVANADWFEDALAHDLTCARWKDVPPVLARHRWACAASGTLRRAHEPFLELETNDFLQAGPDWTDRLSGLSVEPQGYRVDAPTRKKV